MTPLPRRLLLVAILMASAACKRSGGTPPVEGVRPANEARAALLAAATVAPLDGIAGHVDELAHTLGLPFSGRDLLTTLTAQYTLSADLLAQLDGARPIGVAYLAPPARDQPPLEALAASARTPEALERLVASLGPATAVDKGVRRVQRPGAPGALFVAASGTTVVVSSSREGLTAAGALAVEAQRATGHDLQVTLHPDALARWRGTDVRSALAAFRKEIVDEQIAAAQRRGAPIPGRAERIAWEAVLGALIDPLGDTSTDDVTFDLDPQRGVLVGARLQPRSGSAFARQVAAPTPYVVDPALLGAGGGPLVAVAAVGPSAFWPQLYASALAAQARGGVRGAGEVATRFEALRPLLTGAGAAAVHAGARGFTAGIVLPLRPGGATGALDALAGLAGSPGFATLLGEIYGRRAPAVQSRRDGDTLHTELAFPAPGGRDELSAALEAVLGSATVSTVAAVSRERLIAGVGPERTGELARLTAPPAPALPPDLATTLAETSGQDGALYLDLWAAGKPFVAALHSGEAALLLRMPGFAQLRLPVVASYRGGEALAAELRVPLSTLRTAASVLRPLVGAAGAP